MNVRPTKGDLLINTNWRLDEKAVTNREIHTNPTLTRSNHVNIDVDVEGIGRIDVKLNDSGFAACVFSRELLYVRMNGNSVPRLLGFIENEKNRALQNSAAIDEAAKAAIGKEYFQKWFFERFLQRNPNH